MNHGPPPYGPPMPTGPQPYPPNVPMRPPTRSVWRTKGMVIGLAALVAGLVTVVVLHFTGDDKVTAQYEASDYVPDNPFTAPAGRLPVSGGQDLRVYPAGGSGGSSVRVTSMPSADCDPAELKAQLRDDPGAGKAWAQILGLEVSGIDSYIDGLTPEVLVVPLQVTNHEYASGEPRSLQSVLEAGTSVLVDDRGVPRVRCACGNPLKPAAGSATDVTGAPEGFDVATVIHAPVEQSPAEAVELCGVIQSRRGGFVRVKVVRAGIT